MLKRALEIEVQLNNRSGMASDYCNLGVLYLTLGNIGDSIPALQKAEEMLYKALEINQELANEIGIAKQSTD